MDDRQLRAWSEMTLCSAQRWNPNLQDLPVVGSRLLRCQRTLYAWSSGEDGDDYDLDEQGNETGRNISVPSMLAGFTEKDGQPSWLAGTAASGVDKEPIAFVAGMREARVIGELPLAARRSALDAATIKVGNECGLMAPKAAKLWLASV